MNLHLTLLTFYGAPWLAPKNLIWNGLRKPSHMVLLHEAQMVGLNIAPVVSPWLKTRRRKVSCVGTGGGGITYVWTCVWKPGVHIQCLPKPLPTLFSKTALPTQTGAQWLARLAGQSVLWILRTRNSQGSLVSLPSILNWVTNQSFLATGVL